MRRGNQEPLGRASDPGGRDHQVNHVNQQVDGCQGDHSQLLVPDAHAIPSIAACISRPLGIPAKLLVELIERPEDSSSGIEEDGEHVCPNTKREEGRLSSQSHRCCNKDMTPRMKQMEYTATHHTRARWCMYRKVLLMKARMPQATVISSFLSRLIKEQDSLVLTQVQTVSMV